MFSNVRSDILLLMQGRGRRLMSRTLSFLSAKFMRSILGMKKVLPVTYNSVRRTLVAHRLGKFLI